jgi:hypothetical protein
MCFYSAVVLLLRWRGGERCRSLLGVRAGAEVSSFSSACFMIIVIIMKKSINDNRKSRGRPATGTAPLVGVRMTEEFQAEIKTWSKKQPDNPPLATAIRRLVELGLKAKQ